MNDDDHEPAIRPSSPPLNILPSVYNTEKVRINANCTSSTAQEDQKPDLDLANAGEKPEITALLMAQRARTPVAVAVAQDYSAVPFKVPRPLVVLGWFWITDAWVRVIFK